MHRFQRAAHVGVAIVAGTFVVSGLAKLADLAEFARANSGWTIIPPRLVPSLVAVVPGIELFAGGAWVVGVWRRLAGWAMVMMLGVFTAGLAIQSAVLAEPISCGCLGALARAFELEESARGALVRNAALLVLLVPGIVARRAGRSGRATDGRPRVPRGGLRWW